jgi:hypothetical protein
MMRDVPRYDFTAGRMSMRRGPVAGQIEAFVVSEYVGNAKRRAPSHFIPRTDYTILANRSAVEKAINRSE